MVATATWWTAASPSLEAAGIVVGLVLGFANLAWLVLQARQAKVTHDIAVEAHSWGRERRDRDLAKAREEDAKREWWTKMRAVIAASDGPALLPDGIDPAWVTEGERLGHFRHVTDSHGSARLGKPDPLAAAREEKSLERRADAAEAVLVTLARFSQELIGKCRLLREEIGHGQVTGSEAVAASSRVRQRFASMRTYLFIELPDAMNAAGLNATATLTGDEISPLHDLAHAANLLLNELSGWTGRLERLTNPNEITASLLSLNASLEGWILQLNQAEKRGRAILGPIAQLRAKHG